MWLLLGQHPEHHLPGGLASTVQHPEAAGLQSVQRRHVDHGGGGGVVGLRWEGLQQLSSEAQAGADIERQVGVHLGHAGEAAAGPRHVA